MHNKCCVCFYHSAAVDKTSIFFFTLVYWETHRSQWQRIKTHPHTTCVLMHWQKVLPSFGQGCLLFPLQKCIFNSCTCWEQVHDSVIGCISTEIWVQHWAPSLVIAPVTPTAEEFCYGVDKAWWRTEKLVSCQFLPACDWNRMGGCGVGKVEPDRDLWDMVCLPCHSS